MPTTAFTGSLQPKKKADLQEIATALQISDTGTKEELQNRIKEHLDKNQFKLEENPAFSGLYGRIRRKRGLSAQPQTQPIVGYASLTLIQNVYTVYLLGDAVALHQPMTLLQRNGVLRARRVASVPWNPFVNRPLLRRTATCLHSWDASAFPPLHMQTIVAL